MLFQKTILQILMIVLALSFSKNAMADDEKSLLEKIETSSEIKDVANDSPLPDTLEKDAADDEKSLPEKIETSSEVKDVANDSLLPDTLEKDAPAAVTIVEKAKGYEENIVVVNNDVEKTDIVGHKMKDKMFFKNRFSLGTRTVFRKLREDDSGHRGWYGSGTYLGTIYGLDEEQFVLPIYFYVSYSINDYLQIELAYDHIEAKTKAKGLHRGQAFWDIANGREKTDGNVIFNAPTLSFIGKYPNKTNFVPFMGVGIGYFFGDFDANAKWANRKNNVTNVMEIEDEISCFFTTGVEWDFDENWALNLSLQYISITADAVFNQHDQSGRLTQPPQEGSFPMSNVNFRMGITYKF